MAVYVVNLQRCDLGRVVVERRDGREPVVGADGMGRLGQPGVKTRFCGSAAR
jgi:hypothetical protein